MNNQISVGSKLQQIGLDEIDLVIADLRDTETGRSESVHEARKRLKYLRALLRLLRGEIRDDVYQRENYCFRDIGRAVSESRDATALIETLDALVEHYNQSLPSDVFDGVHALLEHEHQVAEQKLFESSDAIEAAIGELKRRRGVMASFELDGLGFPSDALHTTYRKGWMYRQLASAEPLSGNYHEWRKQVKYLWNQVRILALLWPEIFDDLADDLHRLSDHLGDEHDLAMLGEWTANYHGDARLFDEIRVLAPLVNTRRHELQTLAQALGERLYAATPTEFIERIKRYHQAWSGGESDVSPRMVFERLGAGSQQKPDSDATESETTASNGNDRHKTLARASLAVGAGLATGLTGLLILLSRGDKTRGE